MAQEPTTGQEKQFDTELLRIANGTKDTLKNIITKMGGTVDDSALIDAYPDLANALTAVPTKTSDLTNDSYFIRAVPINLTLYTNADLSVYYEADRKAKEIYDAYATGNRIFLTFNGNEYPLVTCLYSSNKYTLIFQNTDMTKKQISQFSLTDGTSAEAVQYTYSTYSLVDSISFTELGDIDEITTVQAADEVSY